MISKKQVEHIAKLARLGLTIQEKEKFQKELSSILDYVEQLKEVDIKGVEPFTHLGIKESVLRQDKQGTKNKILSEKLLKLAPVTKERHLKVKSILT